MFSCIDFQAGDGVEVEGLTAEAAAAVVEAEVEALALVAHEEEYRNEVAAAGVAVVAAEV